MRKLRMHGYTLAAACLLLLTALYSFYALAESPTTWFDEGIYIQAAHSLSQTGAQSIQTAPGVYASTAYVTGGFPFLIPVGLSMRLFGETLFGARVVMALSIILCAWLSFLLMRRLYGTRIALLSLMLIATFPILYGDGKNVLGEVPGMCYLLSTLLALYVLECRKWRGSFLYVLVGMLTGLTMTTKPIFFLFPIALVLVLLWRGRAAQVSPRGVALALIASIVPFALWLYLQFGGDVSPAQLLGHYANPYAKTSLVGTAASNLVRFFKESTPVYCAALMLAWLAALYIRVRRKTPVSFTEWVAFVFSALIIAAFLRTEGWYRYFFEAMLLSLMFFPASMRTIHDALARHFPRRHTLFARGFIGIMIALCALQWYQLSFSSWVAEHYTSNQTALLVRYFETFPKNKTTLVYNVPQVVPFLPSTNYYQYFDIEPTGALAYGKENKALLLNSGVDFVITRTDFWLAHPDLFNRYSKQGEAGAYTILERAPERKAPTTEF